MMNKDSPICAECFGGNSYLMQHIEKHGIETVCNACDEDTKTITIGETADLVHNVFVKFAVPGSDERHLDDEKVYYEQSGQTGRELLYEILDNIDEKLVDPLLVVLRELNWRSFTGGGRGFYNGDECFELDVQGEGDYRERWDEFVELVKHQGRFFNDEAKERLEALLTPLLRGALHDGKPPKLQVGSEQDEIRLVLRARQANTLEEQAEIFANPTRELGPPPPRKRVAGRMNAAGVRAFYGCTDVETAVAEARTPVGGTAVVGTFEFAQPVTVLDLRRLGDGRIAPTSYLDPRLPNMVAYREFVRDLNDIISAPILPGAEAIDYLPTQMLAEYLATIGLGGAIFRSSLVTQTNDETKGLNVVLFNNSSIIERDLDMPQMEVTEILPSIAFDEGVNMTEAKAVMFKERTYSQAKIEKALRDEYPTFGDSLEPTLRLVEEKTMLVNVKGIRYDIAPVQVEYHKDVRS